MNIDKIKKQAKQEYDYEVFREQVELYKQKLRTKKSFFKKIFPYKILIIKENYNE